MPASRLYVVAGILVDDQQRVLLAQRPVGKHLAGAWEFPGGKVEPGESPAQALRRELHEELGIDIDPSSITRTHGVPWDYPGKALLLEALNVDHWSGEPHAREDQALRWMRPDAIDPQTLAPADRPILTALRLPACYAISAAVATDAYETTLQSIHTALERGHTLLQLRQPHWPQALTRAVASQCLPALHARSAALMLNGDIEGARALGHGVGVHLRAAQLHALPQRPLPPRQWVAASCHDTAELALAQHIGVDFAVLGPVNPTASHPGQAAMGWTHFASLLESTALPVYALGGVTPDDLPNARAMGAQGVAGIRAFWR